MLCSLNKKTSSIVFHIVCKDRYTGFIIRQTKSINSCNFHRAFKPPSGISSKSIDDGIVLKSINDGITPKSIGGGDVPKSIGNNHSPSCDHTTSNKQSGSYLDKINPCNHAMFMCEPWSNGQNAYHAKHGLGFVAWFAMPSANLEPNLARIYVPQCKFALSQAHPVTPQHEYETIQRAYFVPWVYLDSRP